MGVEWVKGMRGNVYAVGGGGEEGQLTIKCVHRVLRHAAGKRLEEGEVVRMKAKGHLLVPRALNATSFSRCERHSLACEHACWKWSMLRSSQHCFPPKQGRKEAPSSNASSCSEPQGRLR